MKMINGLGVKIMRKGTNWLYNWALKLPAWALCTVVTVSVATTLMAVLLGAVFILAGVVEKVIDVSDFTIGVVLCILGLFFLYFTFHVIDAFFDRVVQTEIENNKKCKDKSKN